MISHVPYALYVEHFIYTRSYLLRTPHKLLLLFYTVCTPYYSRNHYDNLILFFYPSRHYGFTFPLFLLKL
ncbi:hypothetical protein CW304_14345 [Bacillus sp. UFRGS-B20]|nr:hypothetical protein CW304_14345 [Bacillus sp. UFRGS-B20]